MPWRHFVERGGWWALAQATLMLLVLISGPLTSGEPPRTGATPLGWVLFVMGGAVGIAGVRGLRKNRTIFPKPLPQGELVQSGIYGWIRHPLYVCLVMLAVGWGLVWWSAAAAAASLLMAAFLYAKARREEIWLRSAYPGYRAYAERVKRFIPGLF